MSYHISDLEVVTHSDGRTEVILCDETLKLILAGLPDMDLSLPIKEDQWETVEDYLEGLDIGIASREEDRIYPTEEYDERVCRAVDEIKIGYGYDYIDYCDINRRLAELMEKCGKDGVYVLDYDRWLPKVEMKSTKKGLFRKH